MSVKVDACGLACPQPVIATKKALDTLIEGEVLTIVDNAVAKENVMKFAAANGCGVCAEEKDGRYYIRILKGNQRAPVQERAANVPAAGGAVYLITQDALGHGSAELGGILIKSFFAALLSVEPLPSKLLFLNSGVKLAVEGSPVLEALQSMADQGVDIASCGTCLDYYHLKEKLAVGAVTNMYAIIEAMAGSPKAITL